MDFYPDHFFTQVARPILQQETFRSMKAYKAHGPFSVYDHCLRVALYAYGYAKEHHLKLNYRSLIIGSLLHDYYLYDWHHTHEGHRLHGFRHPFTALRNARRDFRLTLKECRMIRSHMFPVTFWILPLSKEEWVLTLADKRCAGSEHQAIRQRRKDERRHGKRCPCLSL